MSDIKVNVTKTQGGLLVKIDDPRWTVKATAAGILIKPTPGASLEQAIQESIIAKDPQTVLAALRAELRGMHVPELRALCLKAKLTKKGTKPELIERLVEHAKQHGGKAVG